MVEKIRELCVKQGKNIHRLEQDCELPKGYIYKWNEVSPSVDRVKRVADYLGVQIEDILPKEE